MSLLAFSLAGALSCASSGSSGDNDAASDDDTATADDDPANGGTSDDDTESNDDDFAVNDDDDDGAPDDDDNDADPPPVTLFSVGHTSTSSDQGTCRIRRRIDDEWVTIGDWDECGFNELWGSSPSDLYAVGFRGNGWFYEFESFERFLVHYDGTDWTVTAMPNALPWLLTDVHGAFADDVYVTGWGPYAFTSEIDHFDGSSWRVVWRHWLANDILYAIAASPSGLVVAAGACEADSGYGTLFVVREHGTWMRHCLDADYFSEIRSVWIASDDQVFAAVGRRVMRYAQGAWTTMTAPGLDDVSYIDDIMGTSPTNIFATAVMRSGAMALLHLDGARWIATGLPIFLARDIYARSLGLWVASPNSIYASATVYASYGQSESCFVHYDGFRVQTLATEPAIGELWGFVEP
ncbi:MAG: hypothetical protein M5R36_25545 [Deltaproteobacteria bacterium]|nr:hypothetical protein [Deltaproteobacteria bacterium]